MVAPARTLATQVRLLKPPLPYLLPDPPPVESAVSEAFSRLRGALDPAISRQIRSGTELLRSRNHRREGVLPTTIERVDALLNGGLARGRMVEIAGRGARFSLVIATLAAATSIGEAAALIDLGDAFDPQIGEAAGIDLQRLLWIRPKTLKQAVTAAEMITTTGFQLVVLDAGLPKLRGRVPDAAWVRLARAAEAHATALVISSPYPLTGTTSEAMLRADRPCARWRGGLLTGMEASLRLEKHRQKRPGEGVTLIFHVEELAVGRWPLAEETANGQRPTVNEETANGQRPTANE
jgi:hypothetical protein